MEGGGNGTGRCGRDLFDFRVDRRRGDKVFLRLMRTKGSKLLRKGRWESEELS